MIELAPMQVASLAPKNLGWSEQSIDGSSLSRSAYRLSSTRPIVAYQFNPLDNEFVFSNDGSLCCRVIPTATIILRLRFQRLTDDRSRTDFTAT